MKIFFIAIGVVVVLSLGAIFLLPKQDGLSSNDSDVVSTGAFHWHPELVIYVKGEKQEIPQNIGLTGGHKPIHTHDDVPVVHMEFNRAARTDEVTLGMFFKNWGKDFYSFGQNVTMTVNGKENTAFENYPMKDGDKIELRYE